ncbi:MAG: 3-phosphoshikimate 1-carboxyvinyltransferase [Bacteroidetes bacterium]|nr:3-phosphoshikimate 1-carboxyvinyltransferase [Bacteroidota bacterium]
MSIKSIKIKAADRHIAGEVEIPLSKSISNRALMIHTLSGGRVKFKHLSDAADTVLMQKLLAQINEKKDFILDAKNSGTVFRFLTAYLAITEGQWLLKGNKRMLDRPVGPLVEALQRLGAEITYAGKAGFPPLHITGKQLEGGSIKVKAEPSSQFISAMMMIAPLLPSGLEIHLEGKAVSTPYLNMTAEMMKTAGINVDMQLPIIKIPGRDYGKCTLPEENDWSAAAFWYEAIALSEKGSIFLPGLKKHLLQGDSEVANIFRAFGVNTQYSDSGVLITKTGTEVKDIKVDLSQHPDLALPVIVTAAALGLNSVFTGLASLRIKESDRLAMLYTELEKTGVSCKMTNNSLSFSAQKMHISKAVSTYGDHRMAMAFAPLALLGDPVLINDPEVVSKSYPGFWKELQKVLSFKF